MMSGFEPRIFDLKAAALPIEPQPLSDFCNMTAHFLSVIGLASLSTKASEMQPIQPLTHLSLVELSDKRTKHFLHRFGWSIKKVFS